ncbi:MAG: rod shape-determining protein MreC [Desulfamplus sp.]|nr:rod shape-determining protein MreC [Desulfamplus sp.]
MFSRKTAFLIGIVLFVATTFTILTVSSRNSLTENGVKRIAISLISPFQMAVSASFRWCADIWYIYFASVSAGEENIELKRQLAIAMASQNRCKELELENSRLRRFIDFDDVSDHVFIAAKVIGRDPSPWFQTLMINKGGRDGIVKGLPVLVSEGVVGKTVEVSEKFSRVLLITDRNSAVDALVQSSRARGIVQGNNTDRCLFKYALRKDEIMQGDIIISSGLDQVFPKGLRIGEVLEIKKDNSDLFQMIFIKTFVDFDKLEEVLVSSKPTDTAIDSNQLYMIEDEEDSINSNIEEKDLPLQEEGNVVESVKKSVKNRSSKQSNISTKKAALEKPSNREGYGNIPNKEALEKPSKRETSPKLQKKGEQ